MGAPIGFSVTVLMMDTAPCPRLLTYARLPAGLTAIAVGLLPT